MHPEHTQWGESLHGSIDLRGKGYQERTDNILWKWDFPGGPVVKNSLCNAGGMQIQSLFRELVSHMPRSN